MRSQLARALMCPSDLLLLDEPTNHLDLDALVWLEAWLKQYAGTMVVISHDREFLDAVTDVTLHIDHGKLVRYGGNYSKFEDMRAEQLILQQAVLAKQQEKMAHLQKFIDRFKAKASKAKQAQSRVKALERMEKIALVDRSRLPVRLQGAEQPAQSDADHVAGFLRLSGGGGAAEGAPPTVIVGVNRSVLAGQRIGILGANGQGKSTLVKTVAEALAATGGEIIRGKGLNIGYSQQGAGRAAAGGTTRCSICCAWRAKRRRSCVRRPTIAASRACATSWAPSISAATWSSRRWAA